MDVDDVVACRCRWCFLFIKPIILMWNVLINQSHLGKLFGSKAPYQPKIHIFFYSQLQTIKIHNKRRTWRAEDAASDEAVAVLVHTGQRPSRRGKPCTTSWARQPLGLSRPRIHISSSSGSYIRGISHNIACLSTVLISISLWRRLVSE